MKSKTVLFIIMFELLILTINISSEQKLKDWAKSINLKGVPNLHKVTNNLYRSAQPNLQGFIELKKLGIKTIINLTYLNSDQKDLENMGFNYFHISMRPDYLEEKDVIKILKIVSELKKGPFLIHCHYGADRTGTICAVYRIVFCGWTKDEAIDEMVNGGFGFHSQYNNLITFIKELDIEKIKTLIGL